MAEISTEMLVKNLVGIRLNELSIDLSKVVDHIAEGVTGSKSISKRQYSILIYLVEKHCRAIGIELRKFYPSDFLTPFHDYYEIPF